MSNLDWLLVFLDIWVNFYVIAFNYGEFATIRNQAGLNSIKISVKEFVARTNGDKGQIPVTSLLGSAFNP